MIISMDSVLGCCCCCSVAQSCLTLCNPVGCSTPGLHVLHHLPKFAQVHVYCLGDAIQPSHPLTPSSPSALNLSLHQGLFSDQLFISMTNLLEFQLQHQSFQWVFRVDFPSDWLVWAYCCPRDSRVSFQHHSSKTSIPRLTWVQISTFSVNSYNYYTR